MTVQFTVVLSGTGNTMEEAWADAVVGLSMDPGCVPEDTEIMDSDEIEDEVA